MKAHFSFTICLTLILATSCRKEDPAPVPSSGFLTIDIGLQLHVTESSTMLKAAPQLDEFKVNIYRSDGALAVSFDSLALIPDTLEIEAGDYYLEAYSDNNVPAEFLNPHYYGLSPVFSIENNRWHSVQVLCQLSNTIVSVSYSQNITDNFADYVTTVSSDAGFLVYTKDEIRQGFFQPLPLDILVELTYVRLDGLESQKTLTGNIPDPQPNRHYEIRVDASIDQGMASIVLLLDSSEVVVEVVNINEDSPVPSEGALAHGDLLITEVMYDPSALSDTEGEWFEIYNNSGRLLDLGGLILDRDGTNSHTISGPLELEAGGYMVFMRTETATDAMGGYIYGTSITLSNTGSILTIYNEDAGSGPGTAVFSLDYGASGFPDASGASIGLDPGHQNVVDAAVGTHWCVSSSPFNTGDAGTPGLPNDGCQ